MSADALHQRRRGQPADRGAGPGAVRQSNRSAGAQVLCSCPLRPPVAQGTALGGFPPPNPRGYLEKSKWILGDPGAGRRRMGGKGRGMTDRPLILWFRRDLRSGGPADAVGGGGDLGRPVVPVFILDPETEALGAAPKWRLGLAVEAFATALAGLGLRLCLRRGPALDVLRALVAETGAGGVWWSRLYDPASGRARYGQVKAALKAEGVRGAQFRGAPAARALGGRDRAGRVLPGFHALLEGDAGMRGGLRLPACAETVARGDGGLARLGPAGGLAAGRGDEPGGGGRGAVSGGGRGGGAARLRRFLAGPVEAYAERRDFPGLPLEPRACRRT
jgi:deoxyribodipyrimidine photo-lyase